MPFDIREILRLEGQIKKLEEEVKAGRITEEQAERLRQTLETLISLEKAKRVSPKTLSMVIDI